MLCHVHKFRLMHTRPIRNSSVVGTLCLIPFIMTKGGMACLVAHHNYCSTAILLHWCTQNCHSTACPDVLVHTTTIVVQLILMHWCMPQLSWHGLSFCTGAYHNCHSTAHSVALVYATTVMAQPVLLHWCIPQLLQYGLYCCNGVCHNCRGMACPVALVHTTTVIVQLIFLHWCMPQLSWHSLSCCTGAYHNSQYSLSCCTGVCHNCHGIACPFALVHTTTVIVQLILLYWCMPQLTWHSLSFCTGAHHNSHSRALYLVTAWHKSLFLQQHLHLV